MGLLTGTEDVGSRRAVSLAQDLICQGQVVRSTCAGTSEKHNGLTVICTFRDGGIDPDHCVKKLTYQALVRFQALKDSV